MTRRCSLCGELESENTSICVRAGDVCYDCIDMLVENEIERRGVAEEERRFHEYWSGIETAQDRRMYEERQQLRDAGRGHLIP